MGRGVFGWGDWGWDEVLVKMTVQLHTSHNLRCEGQVVKMIFFSPWFISPFFNFQDFGVSEQGKKLVQSAKHQPVVSQEQKETPDVHVWEEDDVDSVKVTNDDYNQNIVFLLSNHA